jgi:hypothetical protein
MAAGPLVKARRVSPIATDPAPSVSAALRDSHKRWMGDTLRWLSPTLSANAGVWDGWSAVRYINDQCDRQYRRQRTLVRAILPLLRPADALSLRSTTMELELMRRHLNRVAGRHHMSEVVAAASCHVLELLAAWFGELQRVTQGLTQDKVPPQGQRALARLASAIAVQK